MSFVNSMFIDPGESKVTLTSSLLVFEFTNAKYSSFPLLDYSTNSQGFSFKQVKLNKSKNPTEINSFMRIHLRVINVQEPKIFENYRKFICYPNFPLKNGEVSAFDQEIKMGK